MTQRKRIYGDLVAVAADLQAATLIEASTGYQVDVLMPDWLGRLLEGKVGQCVALGGIRHVSSYSLFEADCVLAYRGADADPLAAVARFVVVNR